MAYKSGDGNGIDLGKFPVLLFLVCPESQQLVFGRIKQWTEFQYNILGCPMELEDKNV